MGSPYKTVSFYTFGCKVNFTESSTIGRQFYTAGYSVVDFDSESDVCVINTCSVTDNADKKAKKLITRLKDKYPNTFIAVIGCYAQLKPEEISNIPGVNIVLGANDKYDVVKYIEDNINADSMIVSTDIDQVSTFNHSYSLSERTRAFLKVQDGCDYSCSYCTIPLARGKSISGELSDLIDRANKISQSGFNEIILSGINIGDYRDKKGNTLIDLLNTLETHTDIPRFRISSIEPNLLDNQIIDFVFKSNKFVPHFHIPMQSGSDKILNDMKRRYKIELYIDRVKYIKSIDPYACIGSDVIVGFPTETDNDFQETYHLIKSLPLSYLHVFPYSERSNTLAIRFENRVSDASKKERSMLLRKLSILKNQTFYKLNKGKIQKVLFEDYDNDNLIGFSSNYIKVKMKGKKEYQNKIIDIKLNHIKQNFMTGTFQYE